MIRKASINDLDAIEEIYNLTHDLEETGQTSIGWKRGIYPTGKTAEDSIKRNDMYVYEINGIIVACAIINNIQVPEYVNANWEYNVSDDKITVLHTLVVSPRFKGQNIGKEIIDYYEQYANDIGRPYLRMDTNSTNTFARAFYEKLGYKELGTVDCNFNGIGNIDLVCLEKISKYFIK